MERRDTASRPLSMDQMTAEADFVARVQPRSFEEFYRVTWADVYRPLCLTLRDPDLARESTDEAMARAYRHWRTVRAAANPAGWVYRVALNWAIDRHRRSRREILGEPPERPVWMPDIADPELYRGISSLPVSQRAVIVLRVLHDWSQADTAEALGIPVGTVKSRLNRALANLARRINR